MAGKNKTKLNKTHTMTAITQTAAVFGLKTSKLQSTKSMRT